MIPKLFLSRYETSLSINILSIKILKSNYLVTVLLQRSSHEKEETD